MGMTSSQCPMDRGWREERQSIQATCSWSLIEKEENWNPEKFEACKQEVRAAPVIAKYNGINRPATPIAQPIMAKPLP